MQDIYSESMASGQLCYHGCGLLASHKTKKGKLVCHRYATQCPALVQVKEERKRMVGSDGLTANQRKAIKTSQTKLNTVDEDGLNINQRSAIKTRDTKYATIDDSGRNVFQISSVKAIQTLKTTIDTATGLTRFELTRHINQKNTVTLATALKQSEIFLQNKYTKWYYNIINKAKSELRRKKTGTYYERHHIIPRSLGGKNDKNLVLLTGKEHFLCHLLLVKMTTGNNRIKMLHAVDMLSNSKRVMSRNYQSFKEELAKARSTKMRGNQNARSKRMLYTNRVTQPKS